MLRMLPPGGLKTPPPAAPPQGPPAGGPPPELLAALAAQGGGDTSPPDTPDNSTPPQKGIKYSIDKVSQDVARYLAPGSTCGTCHFFDGKGGCHVVSGSIDPAATCSLWSGDDGSDQDDPTSPDSQENDDVQGPPEEPADSDPTQ